MGKGVEVNEREMASEFISYLEVMGIRNRAKKGARWRFQEMISY